MFSVVIPLYNKEDCIEKTLHSVLNQSYLNFEVIIVDDGSTDQSVEIVSSINDQRIRLITQPNGGPSAARNTGIQNSSGDFIAFIDADDIWDLDYLLEMDQLIKDFPNGVLYGFNYTIIENGNTLEKVTKDFRGYIDERWKSFPFFFCTSASCCRTIALKTIGGFDERMIYGEDMDVWFRLLLKGKGVLDSRIMAYYYKDADDTLTKHNMPLEKHLPYYLDKYKEARSDNHDFRRFFDEQMIYRLYPYLFDKKYKKEVRRLSKQLDYSQLKASMRFRMKHPRIYCTIKKVKAFLAKA